MKVALFSDVHGHLRLLLRLIRNWQHAHASRLEAAVVAGDLGCYPDPSKFDRATKRWIKRDPEETGFAKYFASPVAEVEHLLDGDFGVQCPILFVPGNHEDFGQSHPLRRAAPHREHRTKHFQWIATNGFPASGMAASLNFADLTKPVSESQGSGASKRSPGCAIQDQCQRRSPIGGTGQKCL